MEDTHLERPCGLCGGVGNSQLMVTCSRCRETRQHLYCFPVVLMAFPDNWLCEECQSIEESYQTDHRNKDVGTVPAATQCDLVNQGGRNDISGPSRAISDCRRPKPVRGGKVRFLPPEEAIRLISVANKNPAHRQNRSFSSQKSPPRHTSVSIPSMSSGQVGRQLKEQKAAPVLELQSMRQRAASINLANEIRVHKANVSKEATNSKNIVPKLQVQPMMERFGKKRQITFNNNVQGETRDDPNPGRLHMMEQHGKDQGVASINHEHKVGTPKTSVPIEEARDPKTTLTKFDLYIQHFPALAATWKGSIECSDATAPVRWYGGFQAFPSQKIHRKGYEFSKMMPTVLQVKPLPLHQVLADLFQSEYPNFQDIGLYFFPAADITRSEENYISLFQLLESHSSVLRACINSAELLLFTSKQLSTDSHAAIATFQVEFVWGIFRPTIVGQLSTMTCKEISAPV